MYTYICITYIHNYTYDVCIRESIWIKKTQETSQWSSHQWNVMILFGAIPICIVCIRNISHLSHLFQEWNEWNRYAKSKRRKSLKSTCATSVHRLCSSWDTRHSCCKRHNVSIAAAYQWFPGQMGSSIQVNFCSGHLRLGWATNNETHRALCFFDLNLWRSSSKSSLKRSDVLSILGPVSWGQVC